MALSPEDNKILNKIVRSRNQRIHEKVLPITGDMVMPNQSGDHSQGKVRKTPTTDYEIANKKYVDDTSGAGGDVTAAANLTDVKIVQGDGGAKGVKTSTVKVTEVASNTTHRGDNTQAHSDYLLNSAADVGVGLTLTGDNTSADTAYVPQVLFGTDASPPAASGFTKGTIYIQYTA